MVVCLFKWIINDAQYNSRWKYDLKKKVYVGRYLYLLNDYNRVIIGGLIIMYYVLGI